MNILAVLILHVAHVTQQGKMCFNVEFGVWHSQWQISWFTADRPLSPAASFLLCSIS
jgi:hypothetical protein